MKKIKGVKEVEYMELLKASQYSGIGLLEFAELAISGAFKHKEVKGYTLVNKDSLDKYLDKNKPVTRTLKLKSEKMYTYDEAAIYLGVELEFFKNVVLPQVEVVEDEKTGEFKVSQSQLDNYRDGKEKK